MGKVVGQAKLADGLRVYAIGDIHGCLVELKQLMKKIQKDIADRPTQTCKLVFLGDYVDRGPANKGVLDFLIKLQGDEISSVFLLGNHDKRFHDFVLDPEKHGQSFLKWGGRETLTSYKHEFKSEPSIEEIGNAMQSLVPKRHMQFLRELKPFHHEDDYFFAHAGVNPKISLHEQSIDDLIWIRAPFIQHKEPFEKVVVHGHTPDTKPQVKKNRINVDTRCYETGILTAVVLENSSHRFIQTR